MDTISYRVVKNKYWGSAFDGEGARLYGGRWNSKGVPVVYTSDSLALCALEILVHLPSYTLLADYVYVSLVFDSHFIANAHMIDGWDERPISKVSQGIGDHWIKEGLSAILRVPSVIMPDGYNYLVNIYHPEFKKIKIGEPQPLAFDPRLKKMGSG